MREPLGMCGVRLEARVHIVTAAAAAAQNIIKCCTRCDLEVLDIVLEPLASGEAVLEEDEKGLGVALVDIGGGTTDIAIFTDGAVAHTSVIPIGGHQLTSDIAFGLRTPPHEAEKIKIRSGCALSAMVGEDETLEVASVGGRAPRVLSRHTLCRDIIQPRIEEIFSFVKAEIIRLGCEDMLASGAVITGGTTQLAGMTELGEEILGIPVRRGAPKGVGGLAEVVRNAAFSTAVGLVQYGVARQAGGSPERRRAQAQRRPVLAPAPLAVERVLARAARIAALRRHAVRRQTAATFETSSAAAIGLVRWSLHPAARQAARCSGDALAVSATIGRQNPAARSRLVAPARRARACGCPSGSARNPRASAFAIASSPSVARPTMAPSPSPAAWHSASRTSSSSSATRTRSPSSGRARTGATGVRSPLPKRDLDGRRRAERNREPERRSLAFAAREQADVAPQPLREPLRERQADPGPPEPLRRPIGRPGRTARRCGSRASDGMPMPVILDVDRQLAPPAAARARRSRPGR